MIYLDTKSLEIEYTKGRPTKSEPAFSIPSPTLSTLKSDFQKKLRVAFSKTIKPTNTDIHPHPTTTYPTSLY